MPTTITPCQPNEQLADDFGGGTPFVPVFRAFIDVMRSGTPDLTVESVIEAVSSLVVTAAINMRVQFADDSNCPTVEGMCRVICLHILHAAKEAQESAGEGATKQ